MKRNDELLEKLCPNGVEYRKLEECIQSLKTGLNPRKNFVLNSIGSCFPYITGKDVYNNKINITEKTDLVTSEVVNLINKRANIESGDVLFVSTGTGTVGRMAVAEDYHNNWAVSETMYMLKPNYKLITTRFLLYALQTSAAKAQYEPLISKGSVPHLKTKDLLNVIIPVPPLEVQLEIVHIMDSFTLLSADLSKALSTELEARKQQFDYYRDKIISNACEGLKEIHLEDVSELVSVGIATSATHAYSDSGIIMLRNQNIKENYLDDTELIYITPEFASKNKGKELKSGDIIITRTGYPGIACVVPPNYAGAYTFTTLMVRLNPDLNILSEYVSYFINSGHGKKYVENMKAGAAQQNFGAKALKQMPIFIPTVQDQKKVIHSLDELYKAYMDNIECLKKEINLRQKQYEYYRDKLLNFKEKETA